MKNNKYWNDVNMAIVDCLTIGPLNNWDYASKLNSKYSKDVADEIISILSCIKNIQPNWHNETYDEFLERAKHTIENLYSELSNNTVNVLVNRLAYDWK